MSETSSEFEGRFVVKFGEAEEVFESRRAALDSAREHSREQKGPVTVEGEKENSSYRYVNGELAQFVMETRR